MPLDGRRSVGYKSFFSCNDPKGVVECKTNRKSKNDSLRLADTVEHPRKQKNLSRSFSWNGGESNDILTKGPTDHEQLNNSYSFQLLEISRGAQRLNQVIDTSSKEISLDRTSKDIAKDLLRGALDLKESLAMLGKLQEASLVVSKLKKKQKDKGGGDGGGGELDAVVGIDRTISDRFGFANHRTLDIDNPRLSVDGSTRDCFDELREVIKESFARQNLLPKIYNDEKAYSEKTKSDNLLIKSSKEEKGYFERPRLDFKKNPSSQVLLPKSSKEEKAYFDRAKSDFSLDLPSTSSSQSSHFFPYEFEPSSDNLLPKSSKGEKAYFDRPKSDFSQDLPSTSSSQSSHLFSYEFDSSESSISKSLEEKPKARNVIATLMGLEEVAPKLSQSYPQKHYGKDKILNPGLTAFDIDLPKARRPHFSVPKVDPQPRTLEELTETTHFKGLMTSSQSPRRPEHLSEISDCKKRCAVDAPPIVIIKPLHVSDMLNKELHRPKHEDIETEKILRKWKMKEGIPPRASSNREETPKLGEIHRKSLAEKTSGKRPIQEKGDKDGVDVTARKDKSIQRHENTVSAPVKPKIQKKESTEIKVARDLKAVPNTRKPIEVEVEKSRDASKYLQPNKLVASTNTRKPEREPNFSKVLVSQEKGTTSDSTNAGTAVITPHSSNVQKKIVKKVKQVSEPSKNLVGRKIKSNGTSVDSAASNGKDVTAKLIVPPPHPPGGEQKEMSGNLDNYQSTSNVCASMEHIKPNIEIKTNKGDQYGNATEKKSPDRSNSTRDLLLSSPLFLNRAKELFEIHATQTTDTKSLQDLGTAEVKFLVECAKELLESKSLQWTMAVHPMPSIFVEESKIHIPLERLVNEICHGIEYLKSYCELADKRLIVHKLHTVLQKDMWSKALLNGSWDLGWRKGFTREEIDRVVSDMEQTILSWMIEDVIMDVGV